MLFYSRKWRGVKRTNREINRLWWAPFTLLVEVVFSSCIFQAVCDVRQVNTLVDLLHTKSRAKSLRQRPAVKAAGCLCSLNLTICKGARQVKVGHITDCPRREVQPSCTFPQQFCHWHSHTFNELCSMNTWTTEVRVTATDFTICNVCKLCICR